MLLYEGAKISFVITFTMVLVEEVFNTNAVLGLVGCKVPFLGVDCVPL